MTTSPARVRPSRSRSPRPRRSAVPRILAVTAVVVAAPVLALFGFRAARAGTLPRTVVGDVQVGGMTEAEARAALTDLAQERAAELVVVARGDRSIQRRAGQAGYSFDVDATLAEVMSRGRQANPVVALADHLRAFRGDTVVTPVESVDDEQVSAWLEQTGGQLTTPPREGAIRFEGDEVVPVEPEAGAEIDVDAVAAQLHDELLGDRQPVEAPTIAVEPRTTTDDVEAALAEAETALSGDVTLTRGDAVIALTPEDLGGILGSRIVDGDGDAAIDVFVRPKQLTAAIGADVVADLEAEAESARIELSGDSIQIIEAREGFTYNQTAAARQLSGLLKEPGDRVAELAGKVVVPDLTTDEARDLQITEPVSSFTTYHDCCESRVTNIHRIADIIDGQVVLPGETFSVNGFVGERTEEKGFVGGGAIFEGEFVEQVGGGVSQFATTMYNAAWFGGYDIPEHKAHSYYISRYPEGREATLNYPDVDLKVTNTSPYGLLIDTSYSDTSITVTFWGRTWVDVETVTGPRTNIEPPGVTYRENDELRKGETRVIQEAGGSGFDVTVTRTLTYPDGRTETDEVFTRYLPQDRIVERNT